MRLLCVGLALLLAFQGCAPHTAGPASAPQTEEPVKRPPSFSGPSMRGEDLQLLMALAFLAIVLAPVWVPIWLIYKTTHKEKPDAECVVAGYVWDPAKKECVPR